MGILSNIATVALRQVVGDSLVNFLGSHFNNHSKRLISALHTANERAWKALEIALAGDHAFFWKRLVTLAGGNAEALAFAEQIRPSLANKTHFRRACLQELREARKSGLLTSGNFTLADFASSTNPAHLVAAESRAMAEVGKELEAHNKKQLADLIRWRMPEGPPLLLLAVRYFFRRSVEEDPALANCLVLEQMDQQAERFKALSDALERHGELVQVLLGDVRAIRDLLEKSTCHGRSLSLLSAGRASEGLQGGLLDGITREEDLLGAVWDGITRVETLAETLGEEVTKTRIQLAQAAYNANWAVVFNILSRHPDFVNCTSPESSKRYTPLHQAAYCGAGAEVVNGLLSMGAWRTLRNYRGERPVDVAVRMGRTKLISLLEPQYKRTEPIKEELLKIQGHFHELIQTLAEPFMHRQALQPPELEPLLELDVPRMWFWVPGMSGGFSFWLEQGEPPAKLAAVSCGRALAGERYEITSTGSKTVAIDA